MHQVAPTRIGVVGTGVMGGHHTRVASLLPHGQLLGIYDLDLARATQVADQYNVTAFPSLEALCEAVDAVIVASPSQTHAEVGAQCLRAGCHVLLEKPIATRVADAEALVALSKDIDRVLMIGHLERFNPAMSALMAMINRQELFDFELQRLSPTPPRDRSADIIFDLMIHDIDLALTLAASPVASLAAVGQRVQFDFIDHVSALLRFENGVTARLTASAMSQERIRKGRFFTRSAQFTVDLASREVWIHRQGKSSIANEDGQYYLASQVEQLLLPNREPLALEQEHFIQTIQSGGTPMIDAEAGLAALRLAQSVQDAVNEQLVEHV